MNSAGNKQLYADGSKHSIYQNLPDFVSKKWGYKQCINEEWRGDKTRFEYVKKILKNINYTSFSDIGANTGFFCLSLANEFRLKKFIAYEINSNHCQFINNIINEFKIDNLIVENKGVILNDIKYLEKRDIALFFNVLHHIGVDFDKQLNVNKEMFYKSASNYLLEMSKKFSCIIFQMGYNHGGDKEEPIVSVDELEKMLYYQIEMLEKSGWRVIEVAYARNSDKKYISFDECGINLKKNNGNMKVDKIYKYFEVNNIKNNSEFYKRPIIVAEAKEI